MKRTIKSFFCYVVLLVLICCSLVFAGSNNGYFTFSNVNAFVTVFVSFTEGPLMFQDKSSFTATLSGTDKSLVGVPFRIEAGTVDNQNIETWALIIYNGIATGELNISNGYTVSGTDVSIGYGHSGAKVTVTVDKVEKPVIARN